MADFIAEISSNHNGDLDRCRRLIEAAARIGCRGVKFQFFRIEKLFAPQVLRVSARHQLRRRWELPAHFLPHLATCAHDHGLTFGCTPFDLDAVATVAPHVDFLKIASYELPWLDLVHAAADTGKPLMISTGMADAAEAWSAVEAALEAGCDDLTMLHCVSRYPAPEEACNLAAIGTLRELMDRNFAPDYPDVLLKAGWSDHSVSPGIVSRAVHHWAADVVEFHFDLEGKGEEYGGGHCWLPDAAARAIQGAFRPVDPDCDGTGRIAPQEADREERGWRADPGDGLRPTIAVRRTWPGTQPGYRRTGPDVFFLVDGAGLGHVARCLALAEELRDAHDCDVFFFVRDDEGQKALLDRHGFNHDSLPDEENLPTSVDFLDRISREDGPAVCVLDADHPVDELADRLRRQGQLVVVLDQPDNDAGHLGVVPSFGWRAPADRPDLVGGEDYLLVRSDVTARRGDVTETGERPRRIVVSFGGLDPNDLTTRVAAALHDLKVESGVQIVVGPGFEHARLKSQVMNARFVTHEVILGHDPLETLLEGASLLITALGVSVSEALAMHVPVAVLANYESDAPAVSLLRRTGAVADLGRHDEVEQIDLCVKLAEVIQPENLRRMRAASVGLVDGEGPRRTAGRIMELVARGGDGPC